MNHNFEEKAKELVDRHYRIGDKDYLEQRIVDALQFVYKSTLTEVLETVGKLIRTETPMHGSCCTCQECGLNHDSCVCLQNECYRKVIDMLSERMKT